MFGYSYERVPIDLHSEFIQEFNRKPTSVFDIPAGTRKFLAPFFLNIFIDDVPHSKDSDLAFYVDELGWTYVKKCKVFKMKNTLFVQMLLFKQYQKNMHMWNVFVRLDSWNIFIYSVDIFLLSSNSDDDIMMMNDIMLVFYVPNKRLKLGSFWTAPTSLQELGNELKSFHFFPCLRPFHWRLVSINK